MKSRSNQTGNRRWLKNCTRPMKLSKTLMPSPLQPTTPTVSFSNQFLSNLDSAATGVSMKSYGKRMAEARDKAESRPEFDTGSVTSEVRNKRAEDRMASKIAAEVLKENSKLRGVHSKESIKKILEKEALK